MIKPKDIENKTMTPEKRKEACNSYFAFYIGRPLSYIFTVPLLYTNILPNTITWLSIACAIIGFFFLAIGESVFHRLIGLLFFFMWNMGDGIDGNIARYKNLKSKNGDLLDTLGGYVSMSLILFGMGFAAYNDTNGNMYSLLPILLSGISSISTLIPRVLMHRKMGSENSSNEAGKLKDKASYSRIKVVALNICDPAGFQEVFMLVAIIFHLCSEFTIIYFIINLLVMIYSVRELLK